jgi:type II secretory pathway pseudopilin PulG
MSGPRSVIAYRQPSPTPKGVPGRYVGTMIVLLIVLGLAGGVVGRWAFVSRERAAAAREQARQADLFKQQQAETAAARKRLKDMSDAMGRIEGRKIARMQAEVDYLRTHNQRPTPEMIRQWEEADADADAKDRAIIDAASAAAR